jgi:hypothetical protein
MAWWKTAKPGDKIVCIKQGQWVSLFPGDPLPPVPTIGKIYTVRYLIPESAFSGQVGVILEEYPEDHTFQPQLFRPVQPKSTDKAMAQLKELLNTAPVEEKV